MALPSDDAETVPDDALHLLAAADDEALRCAIGVLGGPDAAKRLLLQRTTHIQPAYIDDYRTLKTVLCRIDALTRDTG
jgi:hypothetical protein